RSEDEPEQDGWRWWLTWAILLSVGASLVDLQFGGFYSFNDPAGVNWQFDGHGWPLVHQHSLLQSGELHRTADVAIYFAALAVNLLSLAILLAAAKFVVGRWLLGVAGLRRTWRTFVAVAAGWLAALAGVLWIERWFAAPVAVPGTAILFYTPLVHLPWYSRGPVVFGLACALFVVGWWVVRGAKAFVRLRDEGVL
ncbi:MAG TPA: hypothetical protein VMV10_31365, partial [Pirellulales bacterium]|nr:hypothetical protein [Pirellulales bacterium]